MPDSTQSSTSGQLSIEDQGPADLDELAQQFGELARTLEAEDNTEAMLDDLIAAAVRLVPGAQEASLTLVVARREVTSQHASSELPRKVDGLQSETGEGPCLDSVYEEQTVRVDDLSDEQRWPNFSRRASSETGARSMLALQLFVQGDNLGALNLYSREARAFDDESEQVGLLFASHAAVAFAGAQKMDNLQRAVDSRDLIGQAKGILMERFHIDQQRAFGLLVRMSSTTHRKLIDVAEQLTLTGELPPQDRSMTRHR